MSREKTEFKAGALLSYLTFKPDLAHRSEVIEEFRTFLGRAKPSRDITCRVLRTARQDIVDVLFEVQGKKCLTCFDYKAEVGAFWKEKFLLEKNSAAAAEAIQKAYGFMPQGFDKNFVQLLDRAFYSGAHAQLDALLSLKNLTTEVADDLIRRQSQLGVILSQKSLPPNAFTQLLRAATKTSNEFQKLAQFSISKGHIHATIAMIMCGYNPLGKGHKAKHGNNGRKVLEFFDSPHELMELVGLFESPQDAIFLGSKGCGERIKRLTQTSEMQTC